MFDKFKVLSDMDIYKRIKEEEPEKELYEINETDYPLFFQRTAIAEVTIDIWWTEVEDGISDELFVKQLDNLCLNLQGQLKQQSLAVFRSDAISKDSFNKYCICIVDEDKALQESFEELGSTFLIIDLKKRKFLFPNLTHIQTIKVNNYCNSQYVLLERKDLVVETLEAEEKSLQNTKGAEKIICLQKALQVSFNLAKDDIGVSSIVLHVRFDESTFDAKSAELDNRLKHGFIIVTNDWQNSDSSHHCRLKDCDKPHFLKDLGPATVIIDIESQDYFFLGEQADQSVNLSESKVLDEAQEKLRELCRNDQAKVVTYKAAE